MGNNIGVSQWICIRVSNSEKGTTKILEMFSYTYILHTLTRNIVCVCVWVRILLHPSLLLFVCFFLLLLEACTYIRMWINLQILPNSNKYTPCFSYFTSHGILPRSLYASWIIMFYHVGNKISVIYSIYLHIHNSHTIIIKYKCISYYNINKV